MRYLTATELIALNTRILLEHHQEPVIRNAAGLESISALPQQSFFETDAYPTLDRKLGIVFIKIINLHPFADGNKRTAVAALWTMTGLNGYHLTFTNEELVQIALETAQIEDRQLNYDAIYLAIKNHLIKV